MRVPALLQRVFVFITLLLGSSLLQAAPDHAATEQVRVRLIAERSTIQPGSEVLIGLEQKIIPHWHTYWQNPGDSGMPTSIAWQLPDGASAGPILWPIPGRHKQGILTNYGYSDRALLLTAIKVPANAKAGSNFPVVAKVNWLVCEEICIPQQAELGLTLKIADKAGPANREVQAARAALPLDAPWKTTVTYAQDKVQLRITSPELVAGKIEDIWFYPLKWGKLNHGAPQQVTRDGDTLVLDLQAGEAPAAAGEALEGLLVVTEKTADGMLTRGFNLRTETASNSTESNIGLLSALLLAFAGGIILNLMPCVFPVLSIKALAVIRHGAHATRETRLHGFAYTAGIVVCFLILAGLLLALRSGGAQIGWGFQFQSPTFVLIAAWLMFAIGLSLSGVFVIGTSVTSTGEKLTGRAGYSGSFFTGMLATVVATPCTAPFMGVAIAYALMQPPLPLLAIFCSLGLGLALPFLLLSNWPLLQRCLPKPGAWMERLKQFFAFPMYATAVWLVWVLSQQTGPETLLYALGGMVAIALAAWLFDSTRQLDGWRRPAVSWAALAIVIAALAINYRALQGNEPPAAKATHVDAQNWEPYSASRLQALRDEGKPVFLNFTAAWCITCLANERIALSKDNVIAAFKQEGITYLKGDWTNQDAAITQKLAEFGRNGVPLYVYYRADKNAKPVVLPQLLTPDIVLEHIHSGR